MSYRLTLERPDRTQGVTIYDGTERYPADSIKLTAGNNDASTLTFRTAVNHPYMSSLRSVEQSSGASYANSRIVLTHIDDGLSPSGVSKRPDSELFVGELMGVSINSDGYAHFTCRDYLGTFDMITFRLDQCGIGWGAKNLANLMPAVMTWYNGIRGGNLPEISGCTVVVGYPSGSTTGRTYGRVTPDGTVSYSDNLYPDVLHSYDVDRPRTLLDLLASIAKSIGSVVTLEHSGNTCEIVFHAATTSPHAHVYEHGKDITSLEQYDDWTEDYTAMLATGGTYDRLLNGFTDRDNYARLTLAASASIGDGSLRLRTTSGSFTLPAGSLIAVNASTYNVHVINGIWHKVQSEVTVTTSGTTVEVAPYVQLDLTYSSSSPKYVHAWAKNSDDITEQVGPIMPSTPTDDRLYKRTGRIIYYNNGVNSRGMRIGEFNDSNIIYGTLLADMAAEKISKYLLIGNVDAKIMAVEVTHDYNTGDRSSHTMVGTIVRLRYPSVYSGSTVDRDMRVNGMTISVDDPTQNTYVFGTAKKTATKNVKNLDKSIDNRMYDKGLR